MTATSPVKRQVLPVKSWQDFFAGCAAIAVAMFAIWLSWELPFTSLDGVGQGLMPRAVAVLLAFLGILLIGASFLEVGDGVIGKIAWRGIVFVLTAIAVFSFVVRPLGLMVAAPITILISSLSSSESRVVEAIVFSIAITVFSVVLFKYALKLPIPLAPWLLGY